MWHLPWSLTLRQVTETFLVSLTVSRFVPYPYHLIKNFVSRFWFIRWNFQSTLRCSWSVMVTSLLPVVFCVLSFPLIFFHFDGLPPFAHHSAFFFDCGQALIYTVVSSSLFRQYCWIKSFCLKSCHFLWQSRNSLILFSLRFVSFLGFLLPLIGLYSWFLDHKLLSFSPGPPLVIISRFSVAFISMLPICVLVYWVYVENCEAIKDFFCIAYNHIGKTSISLYWAIHFIPYFSYRLLSNTSVWLEEERSGNVSSKTFLSKIYIWLEAHMLFKVFSTILL